METRRAVGVKWVFGGSSLCRLEPPGQLARMSGKLGTIELIQ